MSSLRACRATNTQTPSIVLMTSTLFIRIAKGTCGLAPHPRRMSLRWAVLRLDQPERTGDRCQLWCSLHHRRQGREVLVERHLESLGHLSERLRGQRQSCVQVQKSAFVWVGTSFGTSVERGSAGFSLHPHPMLTGGEGRDRLWLDQPASCRTWTRCSSRRPCCDMGGAENVARPQRTTSSRLKPALQRRTFVTADVTSDASSLRLRERRSNEPSFCTASTHTKA